MERHNNWAKNLNVTWDLTGDTTDIKKNTFDIDGHYNKCGHSGVSCDKDPIFFRGF